MILDDLLRASTLRGRFSRTGPVRGVRTATVAVGGLCLSFAAVVQPAAGGHFEEDLRVCASTDEAPYSSRDGEGFENKIAEAVAEAMGRRVQFVWSSRPAIYAVRDQLQMRKCDVVVGVDADDERVLSTRPYYRAPYVFIQRADTRLDITAWDSPDIYKARNIGFMLGTPGQIMLEKLGLFREHFNYMHSLTGFRARLDRENARIRPTRMVVEVAEGSADLAVAFAPEVARYVKSDGRLVMTVVPDANRRADGLKIPHHFDQAMGVRKDAPELRAELDAALEKARPRIEAILRAEGIPLLESAPRG